MQSDSQADAGSSRAEKPHGDSVRVVLRIRPLNAKETGEGCSACLTRASATAATIQAGEQARSFGFDRVLGRRSTQEQSFLEVDALLEQFARGFNTTLFAYGQTGSGKTHTVIGPNGALEAAAEAAAAAAQSSLIATSEIASKEGKEQSLTEVGSSEASSATGGGGACSDTSVVLPIESGILPRAACRLFELIEARRSRGWSCTVCVSALEVYREEARCLVGGGPVRVRESVDGGVHAKGLAEQEVDSPASLLAAVRAGLAARATGSTAMNDRSSRSHALCCFTLRQTREATIGSAEGIDEDDDDDDDEDEDDSGSEPDDPEGGKPTATSSSKRGRARAGETLRSKLYLVDLAGAERQKKSKAEGTRLKEAVSINRGLLALGNVINALVARSSAERKGARAKGKRADEGEDDARTGRRNQSVHIPYRDSKLTRLLRDSLGGNARTLMVACVSPADSSYDETLSTLRYASRARAIVNHATLGRDPQEGKIAALRAQVKQLRLALLQSGITGVVGVSPGVAGLLGPGAPAGEGSSASHHSEAALAERADAVSRAASRISDLEKANASLERELGRMSATAAHASSEASELRTRLASVQDQRDAAVGWIGQNSGTFDDIEAEAAKIFASTRTEKASGGLGGDGEVATSHASDGVSAAESAPSGKPTGHQADARPMCAQVSDEAAASFLDEAFDGLAAELVQEHSGQQARLRSELTAIGRALQAKEGQLRATSTSSASMGVVGAEAAAEQASVNVRIKELRAELASLEKGATAGAAQGGDASSEQAESESKEGDAGGDGPEKAVSGGKPGAKKSAVAKRAKPPVPADPAQAARMDSLREEIKSLQGRAKELRRVQALRKKAEARSTQLSSEVAQLRKARQGVTRRMKQETQRFRDSLKRHEKEARDLRKENRKTAAEATRLATLADRQRAALRRKTQDLLTAQRKLRERERLAVQGVKSGVAASGAGGNGRKSGRGGVPSASSSASGAGAGGAQQDASAEAVLRDDNALLTSCAAPRPEGGAARVLAVRSKHLRAVPGAVAACLAGEIRTHLALKGCEGLRESLLKARTQAASEAQGTGVDVQERTRAKAEVAELTQELAGVTASQARLRETSKLGIRVLAGPCKGFGWERAIADVRQARAAVGWMLDVSSAAVWYADKAAVTAEQQVSEAREALDEARKERDEAVSARLEAEARAADASREAEERLVAFMGFSTGQQGAEDAPTDGKGEGSGQSRGSDGRAEDAGSDEALKRGSSGALQAMREEISRLAGVHDKVSRLETLVTKHKAESAAAKEERDAALRDLEAMKEIAESQGGEEETMEIKGSRDRVQEKHAGATSAFSLASSRKTGRKPSGRAGQVAKSGASSKRSGGKARPPLTASGTGGRDGKAARASSTAAGTSGSSRTKAAASSGRDQASRGISEATKGAAAGKGASRGTDRRRASSRTSHYSSSSGDDSSDGGRHQRQRSQRSRNRRRNYVLISESEMSDSATDFYDDSSDSDWHEEDEAPKPAPKTVKKKPKAGSRTSGQPLDDARKSSAQDRKSNRGGTASSQAGRAATGGGRAGPRRGTSGSSAVASSVRPKGAAPPPAPSGLRLSVVQRRPAAARAGSKAKSQGTGRSAVSARGQVRDATATAGKTATSGSRPPSASTGASGGKRALGARKRVPLGAVRG